MRFNNAPPCGLNHGITSFQLRTEGNRTESRKASEQKLKVKALLTTEPSPISLQPLSRQG